MHYIFNKISIFLLLAVATLFGCQQEIDDYYYKDTEPFVDSDVMSLLKEVEDYSQCVELLEQYQIDTLLDKGNVYTLFVINNESFSQFGELSTGNDELIEYLITESYVNLNQLSEETKLQSLGGKFALVEILGDSSYTFDGVEVIQGSPLTNNGRFYELAEVVEPKPNLYEYIASTNEFYREYIDAQDSSYLDKELSTPLGYTDDGQTIYDTVMTTVNVFEETYFPVSEEFRDYTATMLLFTQEQYDNALNVVADELSLPASSISELWQNEVLMPYLLSQSIFRNTLPYSSFAQGRAKNILGDSVDVQPENIDPDFFDCSNARAFDYIDFQVPEHLYKVKDTVALADLLVLKGSNLWTWDEGVTVTGEKFDAVPFVTSTSTFGSNLLVDMGKNFNGEYSLAYTHKNLFPAKYLFTLRANVSKTGVYRIFVNGQQYPVNIGDGPEMEFDFFDLRNGARNPETGNFYRFQDNSCRFEIIIDNITEYGDVEVKLEYVGPSSRNSSNCGYNIDFVSLEYYD